MGSKKLLITVLMLFAGIWTIWAQEYGLEVLRVEPLGGSPWLVPGVPKVVMKIYAEDNDSDSHQVTIDAIRIALDPGVANWTSDISSVKVYATAGGAKHLIAQVLNPNIPVYDPTHGNPISFLALNWMTPSNTYVIPDDGNATFEVEVKLANNYQEGESLRLVVEFQHWEGTTNGIVKCVVDDREDIVSTDTTDKGLETVSDQGIGAGKLQPSQTHVLVQRILLKDNDGDGHNCVIERIEVDNPAPATGTAADIDNITFELDGYATVTVAVNAFPVVFIPPTAWIVPDDGQATLNIYVDVSPFATDTHTFKFKTNIVHTENLQDFEKWLWDEVEEYINVPPGIAGLEGIEDMDVGAGRLSPGGDYDTVMEVKLQDNDPPFYNSDVTVYGVWVWNQGTADITDIQSIEIRHGNQLLGVVNNPTAWGFYIQFNTPLVISDDGSYVFQVKVLIADGATDGHTLRLYLGIDHEETGARFTKYVADGTEEVISRDQINKGLEVLYVVPENSFGTIAPNQTKKVCTLHLEDADGDADEEDVYVTQIRIWNDIRHWGAGVLPLGDREDLFEVVVEGTGPPMIVSVPWPDPTLPGGATPALSPPKDAPTVQPIVLDFTPLNGGVGLRIPDDRYIELVFKVKGNTVVTNGAALRFYFEVNHEEGTYNGFKTDPDGAEEWFDTTGGGGPSPPPQGQINIGDATLNAANNWTAWVNISVSGVSLDTLEIIGAGISYDPTKVEALQVEGIAGLTQVLSSEIVNGHVRFNLVNTTGSPITSGNIARIRFRRVAQAGAGTVALTLSPSDVRINGVSFSGTVDGGQLTIAAGGGVQKGDVNGDGDITLLDAVWVAEYVMNQRNLTQDQLERADVDCNQVVNIMDAYYIVQYVMNGREFPCTASGSAVATSAYGSAELRFSKTGDALRVALGGRVVATVHLRFALIGQDIEVREVSGNGWQILAHHVAGQVLELVAVNSGATGEIRVQINGGEVQGVQLLSAQAFGPNGNPLTLKPSCDGLDELKPELLAVSNVPNPVVDVNTTYFTVKANMPVDAIRVLIYDLAGRLVYDSGWVDNGHAWHLDDLQGRVVSNGVYLYMVQAKIGNTVIQSALRKLAVLR